jgi:hypothetical protein
VPGATNNPVPLWWAAAHEMGHGIFGLEDEYQENPATYTGPEPTAPNLTKNTNRSTIKWASFIDAGTALPTLSAPSCTTINNPPQGSLPTGIIGLYEGGGADRGGVCAIYRPDLACTMNNEYTLTGNPKTVLTYVPFCKVCQKAMTDKLSAVGV